MAIVSRKKIPFLLWTLLSLIDKSNSFLSSSRPSPKPSAVLAHHADDASRRVSLRQVVSAALGITALSILSRPVWATSKSRTQGYAVQRSEDEWKSMLSPMQYFVLREGGTERPGYSALEKEKRAGTFTCAGCGTPLFESTEKFNSRTGWPSFASGLDGVEVEDMNVVAASLGGAELRCKTCGGHLGDVFRDGFLFPGTPAALTGKRFCIDGAALVFVPSDASVKPLRGDIQAPAKALPSFLEAPKIEPRD